MARKLKSLPDKLSIEVSQPKPVWSKHFTLDSKAFFKSLTKAVVKGVLGKWTDALAEVPDLVASFGLETSPEDRAWVLVRRALARATLDLLHDDSEVNILDKEKLETESEGRSSAGELKFVLNSSFFRAPALPVIPLLREDFAVWLEGFGLSPIRSQNLSQRLDAYFVAGVHNEWRSNPKFYEPIQGALDSPFASAAEHEMAWQRYAAHLARAVDEPVFGESFSLRQIYIRPRGFFFSKASPHEKTEPTKMFEPLGPLNTTQPEITDVIEELKCWIKLRGKDNSIRVLSGEPGSGKSSCAKILACELMTEDNTKALFVPLHLLNMQLDFHAAMAEFFSSEGFFQQNPILPANLKSPIVLIFDGLDELEMQGRGAQEMAQQFVGDVIRSLSIINNRDCRLQAIITGRELAVQSVDYNFKRLGQVLHLLPYHVEARGYHDPKGLLKEDQRNTWWKRYGELTGTNYSGLPKGLSDGELGEVTAQPLLNYLVALSFQRGGLTLSAATNINAIYGDLVKAVYERGWAGHHHPSVRGISEGSFVRLLEEVALSAWHGHGRTTTIREIEDHCKGSGLASVLPDFETGASTGISSLLLAFYFRQKGRSQEGDKTFEFTHKSFGEYLTALRIVRSIEIFTKNTTQAASDPDYAWSDEEALARWLALCGPTPMDRYLIQFVRRELAIRGVDEASKAQAMLATLYGAFGRMGWPMERFRQLRFPMQIRWARNAEEALMACLNASARVTKQVTKIDWPSSTFFGEALKRVQGQRTGPENVLIQDCLSYLDCNGCHLDMADLYLATLAYSDFERAEMNFVNLLQANLVGTNFRGARLQQAILENAELHGANFEGARMESVIVGERPRHVREEDDLRELRRALADLKAKGDPAVGSLMSKPIEDQVRRLSRPKM